MPVYEYRCNHCGRRATLSYKTYKDYDAAIKGCPHCGSTELTRLISRVAIGKPARDYSTMSSDEMLNVLEGGNSQEVGRMMQQVGQTEGGLDPMMQDVSERLLKGENPEHIERDLGDAGLGGDDGGLGGSMGGGDE